MSCLQKFFCLKSHITPTVVKWDGKEIHLTNNTVSELPDNPHCPILEKLFLNFNQDLSHIPMTFFDNMPCLQTLDLSGTNIRYLPSSLSKLTTLQELFIKHCCLLTELPPEIGSLKNLKVLDSEGTVLVRLPKEVGSLTKLEFLTVTLYHHQVEHIKQVVPVANLAKLIRLKELSIYLDAYIEWWEDEIKSIIKILPKFQNLECLRLYFPTTQLLEIFLETKKPLSNFGFIVGHLEERVISRIPRDHVTMFQKLAKCVMYTDDEGDTKVVSRLLKDANAFFLEQHWSARSLSDFGLVEMEKLELCLLGECNEIMEIVNESHLKDYSPKPVLGSLKHLSIHFMKSLTCIINGPIYVPCLPNLKTLAMHYCPRVTTIFTEGLLDSLTCLEYLVVEECGVDSLVSLESYECSSTPYLPRLKKISLLHLRKLVSISRGIRIAPRLQTLVIYDCPNLKELSYMEASDDLKEIKADKEWWDALRWCEPEWTGGQPDYLANVFIPLATNDDVIDELEEAEKVPMF